MQPNAGQRIEDSLQGFMEDSPDGRRAGRELGALLLHIIELFAEKTQPAVFLAEGNDWVLEQPVDGFLAFVGERRSRDCRLHEGRDILDRYRQVSEDLEHRHSL